MKKPFLVSFYTPDEYYKKHGQRLIAKCKATNTPHIIVEKTFGKDWISNVRAKPTFLRNIVKTYGGGFYWLDVDCDFDSKALIHLPSWGVMLRGDGSPHDFVHYVPDGWDDFIDKWIIKTAELGRGSHTAFLAMNYEYHIIENGFALGLANTSSKLDYFRA